jgi:hypothetical protein
VRAIEIKDIVGLLLLAVVGFVWFKTKNATKVKKEKPGDLFQVKRIDEDGLILTEDGRYLLMLEVFPISLELRSEREQMMIWGIFKSWLSALPHPTRWRVESQHYNFSDYFQELRAKAISSQDPQQIAYVEELQGYFGQLFDQDTMRDKRYYLFLEIDERYFSDLGVDIPLLTDFLNQNRVNREQDEEIARKELYNSTEFTQSIFMSVGIQTKVMRRDDVLDYLYRNGNRDVAPLVAMKDMKEMGVMETGKKISLTALKGAAI